MKTIFADTFFMTKKYPKSLGKCNASKRSSKHQERLTNYHVGFCSLSKLFGIHPCAPSRIFRGQRTFDPFTGGVMD